jgi:uncharacterized protein (UPF0262 family)
MPDPGPEDAERLREILLDDAAPVRRSPDVEHERRVAIYDLIEDNRFAPVGVARGPYGLHLRLMDNRLQFDIRDGAGAEVLKYLLPLTLFRQIIKDYGRVCESYYEAIKSAPRSRIEAIDMGRRALHDEGAELLREKLATQIAVDPPTARRLFTLIYVMQIRG